MRNLVLGGTGTVGSAVVQRLLARGEEVLVLTRGTEKAGMLPRGARGIVGDLRDPTTVREAFVGAERVFLLIAVSATELQEGLVAVEEARRSGARKLVYLSVHHADRLPLVPHFAGKVAIERAVAASGIPFAVLRPNSFFQNDYRIRDAILQHGVYPQPIGNVGASRVDVRDVADAAVAALTQPGHEGRSYALVGAEAITGEDSARIYTEVLGRRVRYGGDDLAAFAKQMSGVMPSWMVHDLSLMYEHFQREGLLASEQDLRETEAVLGHAPRAYRDFVRELVAA
jgi:uncharacterized protein YbjT (DUF2867 family)